MRISVRKVTNDLENMYPEIANSIPFKFLKIMADTRAIGEQGINDDISPEDYEKSLVRVGEKKPAPQVPLKPKPVETKIDPPKDTKQLVAELLKKDKK